ncbi:hypothetical protein [Deinococcus sp. AJ005]|uniref:hypothetical protein n=1 Tax=Deinococcus sp. AJ005 TaxID=2652443 RepID=UPI00125CBA15|nr:hypothetical protein [Deinococcus sp. AJ005]QFP76129.1 hypothetical protein DAAJ005_06460 [Deinococcus sp. AJ005]
MRDTIMLLGLLLLAQSAEATKATRSNILNVSLPVPGEAHPWGGKTGYERTLVQNKYASSIKTYLGFTCGSIEGFTFGNDRYAVASFLKSIDKNYDVITVKNVKEPNNSGDSNNGAYKIYTYYRIYKDPNKSPFAGMEIGITNYRIMGRDNVNMYVVICKF